MIVKNGKDFKFIEFQKSKTKNKKYDAILMNKNTGALKRVAFGDATRGQYRDTTGLGLYSHLDNNDKERRRLFRLRFKEEGPKYNPLWFSWRYLW